MAFAGFRPASLRLLAQLGRNNDRAWFAQRRERFRAELQAPMIDLVDDATAAFARAKIPLVGDAKRSIFRLHRNLRFSPDKTPYRTFLAAYFSIDGGRETPGGIYVRIEPGQTRVALAFYRLEPPVLQRWRRSMLVEPRRFARVVRALADKRLAIDPPEERDDSLARMPRGFEAAADSELAPYFRLRSFVVARDLADASAHSNAIVSELVRLANDGRALLEFGWPLV